MGAALLRQPKFHEKCHKNAWNRARTRAAPGISRRFFTGSARRRGAAPERFFEYNKLTPKLGMDLLGTMQPTSNFGETFQYSNVPAAAGGWMAAHVVYPDRELGAAHDEAMKTRIFDLLGMKATTFDQARVAKNNHVGPHAEDVDGKPAVGSVEINRYVIPLRPAGDAWTSVHEVSASSYRPIARRPRSSPPAT